MTNKCSMNSYAIENLIFEKKLGMLHSNRSTVTYTVFLLIIINTF